MISKRTGLSMKSDEEKDIELRDRFAIAAMRSLIESSDYVLDLDEKYDDEDLQKEIEKIANRSYRLAKAMRKARLASFK
jgi:hypothetical protein